MGAFYAECPQLALNLVQHSYRTRELLFLRTQPPLTARLPITASMSQTYVNEFSAHTWSRSGTSSHIGLLCGKRSQDFLLFALGHFEVIKGVAKLRSDLIEHLGWDV